VTVSRIKICGLTRQEDVLFAAGLGAWATGFIFHPKSPRYIEPEVVAALGAPGVLKIGVFVDASKDEITHAVRTARLAGIQLHGEETPDFCASLKEAHPGKSLLKAFRLKSETELERIPDYSMCEHILVDAFVEGQPGGTGKIARWDLASRIRDKESLILSGGLTSDNVAQALGQVRPGAFDVSSGVEDRPGIKNHSKIRSFIQTVRIYESQS
jgi:phosphoribosylanthranilate isomerase